MISGPTNAWITDLDPIIVTAPVIRSGTTLVQRLLCSSPRALIYGELCAQDLEFFLNLYAFKTQTYTYHRQARTHSLNRVLNGDSDDWIPDLMPDVEEYLAALGRSAFAGVTYCREYAQRVGRPVWGFKYPGWKPAFIQLLRTYMPRARFIAILRDLGACVRSAKAARALNSMVELNEFCRAWTENTTYWRSVRDDAATLVLDFAELKTAPEATLQRLSAFTGLSDMQPHVLTHKINIGAGDVAPVESHDGYVKPAELTEAEQQLVDATAAALRPNI